MGINMKIIASGSSGTVTIGGITLKVKAWRAVIVQHWYDAWKRRMNRG